MFVNAPKRNEVRAERRACSFAGVAVALALAVTIILPCPLMNTVAASGMVGMAPLIALPRIGRAPRTGEADVLRDEGGAGARIGMVAAPEALLARLAREYAEEGGRSWA